MDPAVTVEPVDPAWRAWAGHTLLERWGSSRMVSLGQVYQADTLPGFVVLVDGQPAGLATYSIRGDSCELVTLNSDREGVGVGSALIAAVRNQAELAGCRRLWLITTNDNTHALRFYQRRGFVLVALYQNMVDEFRRLKPEIPLTGNDGIPLRDVIELEMRL